MDIEEIKNVGNESYDKWFERWYLKKDLESRIKQSAQEGYSGYRIEVKNERNEYLKRRLSDDRIIEKLKGKLSGFDIRRVDNNKGIKTPFGTINSHEHYIVIGWKNK